VPVVASGPWCVVPSSSSLSPCLARWYKLEVSAATSLKLNLLENSQAFLFEAVCNALAAKSDLRKWQFAIVNLVQSLELSVKALLQKKHSVFIYEDIDRRQNTVTVTRALARLTCPEIGGLMIPEDIMKRTAKAIELRNKIVHSDFELTLVYAEAKFLEVFSLVSRFQTQYLGADRDDILPEDGFENLFQMKKAVDLMKEQAVLRIEEEGHDASLVLECRACGCNTFVVADSVDICYTCEHAEATAECPHCGEFCFEDDLVDFSDQFDADKSGGRYFVVNNYGYSNSTACPECAGKIREKIREKKREREEEYEFWDDCARDDDWG